jgi:FkbM family methyltransferase
MSTLTINELGRRHYAATDLIAFRPAPHGLATDLQMTDRLIELLQPSRLTNVVDIGANPIGGDPPYKRLLEKGLCRVVGLEPQLDALDRLNSQKSDLECYLPYAVGDGKHATLNICSASGMTSVLTPDPHNLAHFAGFLDWGQVVRQITVPTQRLDDIEEISSIDFLKIDAQGAELSIFKSGRDRLKEAIAVQTEISFIPLYKDQPLSYEIDAELRSLGFVPHSFVAIKRRMISPFFTGNQFQGLNQLLEADMVYVRDFLKPGTMSAEQLKHLAIVAHFCYGSYDLAANCLHHLTNAQAVSQDALEHYMTAVRQDLAAAKRD